MKSKLYIVSSLIMLFVFSQTASADPNHNKNQYRGNGNSAHFNNSGPKHHNKNNGKHGDYYGKHGNYYDNDWYKGNRNGNDAVANLVYAGITAVLAGQYARDLNIHGYQPLPPGIRKNLARGKPLPPGIAKKTVPGSLLNLLPKHPGYEWRMSGRDLILVSLTSSLIADVLFDVFD